jgi:type IV pilus assembly protein PilC
MSMTRLFEPRPTRKDGQMLCLRLSFLLSSGMPLSECLALLSSQSYGAAKMVARALYDAVEEGKTLAEGMRGFPKVWGAATTSSIAAGEESGLLRESLERAAADLERGRALRAYLVGTLAYPAAVAIAAFILIACLTSIVFPNILPALSGMHAKLPLSTRIVMRVSAAVSAYGLWAAAALAGALLLWRFITRRVERARSLQDRALIALPIAGAVVRHYRIARIARSSASMLQSGLPLPQVLERAARSEPLTPYRAALAACARAVERGESLGTQLARERQLFPAIICQVVSAGERSGTLAEALFFVAAYAEREVEERAKLLSSLAEPAIMMALGLAIGFVAVSIIAPIYSLTGSLHG